MMTCLFFSLWFSPTCSYWSPQRLQGQNAYKCSLTLDSKALTALYTRSKHANNWRIMLYAVQRVYRRGKWGFCGLWWRVFDITVSKIRLGCISFETLLQLCCKFNGKVLLKWALVVCKEENQSACALSFFYILGRDAIKFSMKGHSVGYTLTSY